MSKRKKDSTLIATARKWFHEQLVSRGVLVVDPQGVPSNCDKDSKPSCAIGKLIARDLCAQKGRKLPAQTAGSIFEELVCEFIKMTFPKLQHLRPGKWTITKLGNRNSMKTSSFSQYEHLDYLTRLMAYDSKLAASMGNDYMVTPDVVVYRDAEPDEEINRTEVFVDDNVCNMADLRAKNGTKDFIHLEAFTAKIMMFIAEDK